MRRRDDAAQRDSLLSDSALEPDTVLTDAARSEIEAGEQDADEAAALAQAYATCATEYAAGIGAEGVHIRSHEQGYYRVLEREGVPTVGAHVVYTDLCLCDKQCTPVLLECRHYTITDLAAESPNSSVA